MAESCSQVDSDPAAVAPPCTPIKNGKRVADEIVEHQVAGNKKHKTMEDKNYGMEIEENIMESSQAELPSFLKLAATTQDAKKDCSFNESGQEDDDDNTTSKVNAKHMGTPKESVEVPIDSEAITHDDTERASIFNEYEEEHKDDSFKEDHQHVETPNKSAELPPFLKLAATTQDAKKDCSFNESGQEDDDDNTSNENAKRLETPKENAELPPFLKLAATTQDAKKDCSFNESGQEDDDDNTSNENAKHLETPKENVEVPIDSAATTHDDTKRASISNEYNEEDKDDSFKEDHQHVESLNKSAIEVNNDLLHDHPMRPDLATERDEHYPTRDTGSKTLFLGNLHFSIEEDDVRDFFKNVGEIAEIRFAIKDERFKGYGYIEFNTAEAAQEALKLNKEVLLDRRVSLDFARRQRGAYTPGNSMDKSNQRGDHAQVKTVYVRGFESNDSFDNIRRTLEKHFGKCGEISRLSIPKDYVSGAPKGLAFIEFTDSNGFSQALELDGSEVGDNRLTVEEAKRPRVDGREGSGNSGYRWTGSSGGWSGSSGGWSGSGGGRSGSGGGWSTSGGGRSASGGGRSGSDGGGVRESSSGREGSGGGWRGSGGDSSGSLGGWSGSGGGSSGSGGGWGGSGGGKSGSGGSWSGSGGGWVRESSYCRQGSGGGWSGSSGGSSGSGGGWRRVGGYGSSSQLQSGYSSRSNTKSGPDDSWRRESGFGGGWFRGTGSNNGGFSSSRVGSGSVSSDNRYSSNSHRGRGGGFYSGSYDSRRPSRP